MQSLKYSLKSKQFAPKKCKIFSNLPHPEKNKQEDYLSPVQPAEPKDEEEFKVLSAADKEDSHPTTQSEKKSNVTKFMWSREKKGGTSERRSDNVVHAATKAKVPEGSEFSGRSSAKGDLDASCQTVAGEELQVLKELLVSNEQRLGSLMNFVNNICRSTIQLYSSHERQLRELVNSRCNQIAGIYKSAVVALKARDQKISDIDKHVTVLINKLSDSKQTLRIVKIKQECIEALQKQRLQLIQQKQLCGRQFVMGIDCSPKHKIYETRKHSRGRETESKHEFVAYSQCEEMEKWERKASKDRETEKQLENSQSIQFYYDDSPSRLDDQQCQVSPLEANSLMMGSIPNSATTIKTQPWTNCSEYQLRRPSPIGQSSPLLPHGNPLTTHPSNSQLLTKPASPADEFEIIRKKLSQALKQFEKSEVWLDNLNCLRFRSGAYVLDSEGNAFICSPEQFHALISSKVLNHHPI